METLKAARDRKAGGPEGRKGMTMEQGQGKPEPERRSMGGLMAGGGVAVAVIALLFGLWSWQGGRVSVDKPAAPVAPQAAATAAAPTPQVADAVQAGAATPVPAPVPEGPAATGEPGFDMLRAGQDGTITVAGLAAPGARVQVLLDGEVIDTVLAGADGKFASVWLGQPSAEPRALTLRSFDPDGQIKTSGASLTVAPSVRAIEQAAQAAGETTQAAADQAGQAAALAAKPLLTDAQGVRVLAQGSADLVIDTLAFDADNGVEISGRGAPAGAVLRAYIDNVEAGLVAAGTQGGWQMILPAPLPGAHQLRVDALDAGGKVLARAETEFTAARHDTLEAAAQPQGNGGKPRIITIEKGYTLWAVAREAYGDPYLYVRVFEANRAQIRDPNLIYPGQTLSIPE
ncbi:MAG TPA: hypothetical protein VGC40_11120 [Paenirhodobacter sp.]